MNQELGLLFYLSVAALVLGAALWFKADKKRNEQGEWSSALQWAYLLMMGGVFGILALGLNWSMTAVLLAYTAFSGVFWLWRKASVKKSEQDMHHLRDYMAGFFPIMALIFVFRTFLFEPFIIPSSSMRPGLVKGDFILVNKFAYGIRVPVANHVAIETNRVERGDVAVFNYPLDVGTNYIKRIVGIPGDVVEYSNKVLQVNGVPQQDVEVGTYTYPDDYKNVPVETTQFRSGLGEKKFDVLKVAGEPAVNAGTWHYFQQLIAEQSMEPAWLEHCEYAEDGSAFRCVVPEGKYFAMGDNRDHSADSRYWGWVDDTQLVGKAEIIWLNVGQMSRIGTRIQ